MGEKFDEGKLETMNPGNFISMPKEMRHFALSKTDTRRPGERHRSV